MGWFALSNPVLLITLSKMYKWRQQIFFSFFLSSNIQVYTKYVDQNNNINIGSVGLANSLLGVYFRLNHDIRLIYINIGCSAKLIDTLMDTYNLQP